MVHPCNLGLLGKSWIKRTVKSLIWDLHPHTVHTLAWEQHWSLPKLLRVYTCAWPFTLLTLCLAWLETCLISVDLSGQHWTLLWLWLLLSFFRCPVTAPCQGHQCPCLCSAQPLLQVFLSLVKQPPFLLLFGQQERKNHHENFTFSLAFANELSWLTKVGNVS